MPSAGSRDTAGVQGDQDIETLFADREISREILMKEPEERLLLVVFSKAQEAQDGLSVREELTSKVVPVRVHDVLK